jgi:hypothetical protein
MDLLLIFIFFIILLIIIIYIGKEFKNYVKNLIQDNIKFSNIKTGCLYKRWGCCPDKLTTKLDPQGSNCRGF